MNSNSTKKTSRSFFRKLSSAGGDSAPAGILWHSSVPQILVSISEKHHKFMPQLVQVQGAALTWNFINEAKLGDQQASRDPAVSTVAGILISLPRLAFYIVSGYCREALCQLSHFLKFFCCSFCLFVCFLWLLLFWDGGPHVFILLNKFVWLTCTGYTWSHVDEKFTGKTYIRMCVCP